MRKYLLFIICTIAVINLNTLHAQCPPSGPSDPSFGAFVQNQWTAFSSNRVGNIFTGYSYEYRGYYIDNQTYGTNNLNVNSEPSWGKNSSPSAASNYIGCSINNDRHRVLYTRQGFPEGYYKLSVRHDDNSWIQINGTEVYAKSSYQNTLTDVPQLVFLNQNSKIGFQWTENLTESYGQLEFTKIPLGFGNGKWLVTVYRDVNFIKIAGSFSQTGVSFSTRSKWDANDSNYEVPSDAPNYKGLSVDSNNSYIYKRKGFPCGIYSIDVAEHDDDAELIINGTTVWTETGYKLTPTPGVWTGFLDSNSEIQMKVTNTGGYATSAGLTFNATPNQSYWTGKVSGNISNPANWCPNMPNETTNVFFRASNSSTYNPVLDADAHFKSVTIEAGAIIDLRSNTLEVSGNLINNGTLVENKINSLILNGNTSSVSGTGFEINKFTSNTSTTNLALNTGENVRILDVLSITSGNFNTNDQLILGCQFSDLTQRVGQIGDLSNASITGNVSTEQCIPPRRAFRFLTAPVSTSTSIHFNWQENASAWNDNPHPGYGTHITGTQTDGTDGFDETPSGNPSMFVFDNSTAQWNEIDNTDVTTLTAGVPYRILIRGDRSTNITSNSADPTPTILRAKGSITSGPVNLAAGFSTTQNSYNFFGNPYPAAIDMSEVMQNSTGIQKDYYIWDPTLGGNSGSNPGRGAYVTIDLEAGPTMGTNASGSDANQFLQPGQAAFAKVIVNSTTNMPLVESNKNTTADQTAVFKTESGISYMDLTLYSTNDLENGETSKDGVRIKFSDMYTTSVSAEDVSKFGNLDENIAVLNAENYLAIDRRAFPENDESIPLFLNQFRENNYSLRININGITGYDIFIKDEYLNVETEITNEDFVFNFSIDTAIPESTNPTRFSILFRSVALGSQTTFAEKWQMFPNPLTSNKLIFEAPNSVNGKFDIQFYNVLGVQVLDRMQNVERNRIELVDLDLAAGIYIVRITSEKNKNVFVRKLIVN